MPQVVDTAALLAAPRSHPALLLHLALVPVRLHTRTYTHANTHTALQDKDRFRERYTNLLSKRLLLNKSLSEDVEKMALGRLKVLCGPQYTEKVERMMGDLTVAREGDQVRGPWVVPGQGCGRVWGGGEGKGRRAAATRGEGPTLWGASAQRTGCPVPEQGGPHMRVGGAPPPVHGGPVDAAGVCAVCTRWCPP